jgi:peptide/nickel transport system ATP-binding protein
MLIPHDEKPALDAVVLEVEDLRTEFRLRSATVRAVDGVSFQVGAGECVGLVGESGCGKSTTGLSILRLLPNVGHVTGGTVRLAGRDLMSLREEEMRRLRGNEVAMIFQDPMSSLNPTWTIGRQIAEPYRVHRGATKQEALGRARELLDLVGVPRPAERLGSYPHQLSGGLRQRVMIAIALACSPRVLIADEPTTALDVTIQAQILDLIDGLRRDLQMAVILITHDLGVIAARTDRVLVMYAGKIVEGATTERLFQSMRHPYTHALFQSIPRLDEDRTRPLFSIPGAPPDLSEPLAACRFSPRCAFARDDCRSEEPPLLATRDAAARRTHTFACFHPVGDATDPVQARRETADVLAPPSSVSVGTANDAPVVTSQSGEILLELDGLVKEFPVTSGAMLRREIGTIKAVSDVSFAVRRGETFGLVGESGCGKTTLGWLVVALERPTAGAIRFEGEDIASLRGEALRRRRRDLQLMFQDPYSSLDPRMRVGPVVREPLVVQGVGSRQERYRRASALLEEVGLPANAALRYPHEFSGGQRQRIGLARALALQPKLIVADEPVSALDVSIQAQILNLMRRLQDAHQLTYIVISHDLAVVRYLADTVGVMYLGKLVEIGPAADVYASPAHPYTRGLIDAVPVPDPSAARKARSVDIAGELPSSLSPPSGCRFRTRCPLAQDVCSELEPPLRAFGAHHRAACHFPLRPPIEARQAAFRD